MHIVVLGSAAGGGFPQWNSRGPGCLRARAGDPAARPRTQTSLAVSADGAHWVLLNAAPDLRAQIEATPVLHPREGLRSSPIAAVVLCNGDVDAVAGLLTLRERQPFVLYAAHKVQRVLAANPIFDVLAPGVVERHALPVGTPVPLALPGGAPSGLVVEAFGVPGKTPLYLEGGLGDAEAPDIGEDDTIGLRVAGGQSAFFFIPSCAALTPRLARRLEGAPLVFFDGTLWRDDEMLRAGVGTKTGARMGHMSLDGPCGTLAAFASLGVRRKVLIHLNNTNPVLLEDSPERRLVAAQGWEVAQDGMEITL